MADDNNNCVICLESLCSAEIPIGATVPCGHCFHVECFAGWKHSKRGQSQRESLKCPMCNNQTTSFCRIYLDLGAVDDPDDGCSLSSVESADMGDEEDEEEKEGSAESEEKDDNDEAPPENDTVDVICIDDDDDDDDEQNTTAGSSSDKGKSDGSLSHNKYRKMAKKLKSRVKMLESERQRLGETSKTLSEQHGRLKKEIDEAASNVIIIRTGMATVERQVESLSLEITRIRRERDQATSDLFQAKSKAIKLETQMVEFKKQYAVDVQRAHTNSMAEVQTILKANPKLTEANRRLKEELLRKEERIQRLEARFLGGSLHKNNNNTKTVDRDRTEPQDSVKSVHRSSKDTAKLLRDFQEDDDFEKLSARAPPERTKTKVYANAARFSRASAKAAARPPTNVSALDAIDQLQPSSLQTDKNKRPSLEQARKFTNAPARKRSKILLSSAANPRDRPFAPKMGPQHDIRNMMTRR